MYRIIECREESLNKSSLFYEIEEKPFFLLFHWFRWRPIKSREGFTLKFKNMEQVYNWIYEGDQNEYTSLPNRDYVTRKIVEEL